MDMNEIITEIIDREGRTYSNRAADRGGPTKFGITKATLEAYLGRPVTIEEVQNMEETLAEEIYKSEYIFNPKFNQIEDEHLRVSVIDYGVNSGTARATKALQRIVGAVDDGVLGPMSLEAINDYPDQRGLNNRLNCVRLRFLGRLIHRDPTQVANINGWTTRVTSLIQ